MQMQDGRKGPIIPLAHRASISEALTYPCYGPSLPVEPPWRGLGKESCEICSWVFRAATQNAFNKQFKNIILNYN